MTEKQWSIVTRTNSLCNGYRILYTTENDSNGKPVVKPKNVERAMFTAFSVTERAFSPHEISFTQTDKDKDITLPPVSISTKRSHIRSLLTLFSQSIAFPDFVSMMTPVSMYMRRKRAWHHLWRRVPSQSPLSRHQRSSFLPINILLLIDL